MKFAKHMTFYLRTGWINKSNSAIKKNPYIFSPSNFNEAIDELGIGKVMITSLRYWMGAFGITKEKKDGNGVKLEPTILGKYIFDKDPYLEKKGTIWMLHYKLVSAKEEATTWYWFFNKFSLIEFDEEDFMNGIKKYIKESGSKEISNSSLKKDFLCLKNTYFYENNFDKNDDIEEIISCPLKELKLISLSEGKNKFIKNKPNLNEIAPEIFYFTIIYGLDKGKKQISIEELIYKDNSPGKIFNISINDIYKFLYILENKGYIKVNKKLGNNFIDIFETDYIKVLDSYYSNNNLD